MVSLGANGNIKTYGMKHFILDSSADLTSVPTEDITTGSTAFVISTSAHYMLNSAKKWVKVNLGSGGGGSDEPSDEDIPTVDYDGGDIL